MLWGNSTGNLNEAVDHDLDFHQVLLSDLLVGTPGQSVQALDLLANGFKFFHGWQELGGVAHG